MELVTDLDSGTEATESDNTDPNALQKKMFKLRKKIPPDVVEDLENMDAEALKKRIVQCEMNILETQNALEADDGLAALKEQVKEASGPYRDAKNSQRSIATYCAILLNK